MGVVYEGRDPNLDRRVAIKTVKVENLSEEAAAEYEHRFRTEARSAARLQHPNIVSVYDSDRDTEVAFLVMEYIQGDDLKHHLDRGVRYSLEQSLKIIRDLLSALDYAHKQGIVHRDIKPANLLMEPGGRVKLTDFGVARIQDSGEATRTQGSMVGTLKYMAPEQVQGQKIDARADLFSVGVVLYQLLTDKRPFDGDNDFSIIHQIIGHEPAPPSSINPRLPTALDAVVARALAKDRDDRFATARDFAVALQAAIRRAEDQTVVPPLNPLKRVEAFGSRPLTLPGTRPGGMTTPPTSGSVTSLTQEVELVYWKDVKDSDDPEDLYGFLEKFPGGIYADLAKRRLRRLAAPGESTNIGGTAPGLGTSPGIDLDATRMRDPTRPNAGTLPGAFAAGSLPGGSMPGGTYRRGTQPGGSMPGGSMPGGARFGGSMPGGAMPGGVAPRAVPAGGSMPGGSMPGGAAMRPADWVDQEYTRSPGVLSAMDTTVAQPPPVPTPTPVEPPPAASAKPAAAPSSSSSSSSSRKSSARRPPAAPVPPEEPRKKPPIAVLAGIGVLVAAGIVLAMTLGRGGDAPVAAAPMGQGDPAAVATAPAAPAPQAQTPVVASPPPAETPATAVDAAPVAGAVAVAEAPRPAASAKRPAPAPRTARPASAPAEPARPVVVAPPPRAEAAEPPPKPAPAPAAPAATAAALAAVEQCRDRVFLTREYCLADACSKAGARNHSLCVKHREEVRMREESKVRQGPQ